MSDDDPATTSANRLAELRSAAQGWHGAQLAALGFIGLCGVIKPSETSNPEALQTFSGALILIAFVAGCLGVLFVGKAAWPIYGGEPAPTGDAGPGAIDRASRQLKRGLVLTFVSIALTALATSTSWWPAEDAGGSTATVEVQATGGGSVCGELAESSQAGTLRVLTDTQPVEVQLGQVASVRPVDGC